MQCVDLRTPPVAEGKASGQPGVDLLQFGPVRRMVFWAWFPYVFQAILLAAFASLAVLSWSLYPPQGVPDKLYAKSNLVNLVVWGLWWPAMVWIVVFFGRVWCAVCPLELVANGAERLGRRLGLRQRVLGKWLQGGVVILALYGLIQMLVVGVHLHRIPAYTSLFLWSLLGTAAAVGLLFKDRAFCRGFCPVGLLLGTYGRGAMLAVRSRSSEKCGDCSGRDCVQACNRTRLDARSCPSLLNPAKLNGNSDCLVCGQCIKACRPDNMGLYLRPPFAAADAREPLASWTVTLFVMLVSGFVTSELFSEWKAAQAYYLWFPEHVAELLGARSHAGGIEGVWTLEVVPALLWLVLGASVLAARGATSVAEAWRRLAIPLAVLIAAAQMCKGLAKVVSWVGFLPLAIRDPIGTETALAIHAKTAPQPAVVLSMPVVSLLSMLLVAAGAWFALRELRLAQPETHRRFRVPVAMVTACCLLLVYGWGFLQ